MTDVEAGVSRVSSVPGNLQTVEGDERLPQQADAVVIGGGIVGSAAAYFLAGQGLSVALLEKGQIGAEQSSRNWGWCRQQGRNTAEVPLMKASMSIWEDFESAAPGGTGFRRAGILNVTKDQATVARWENWLQAARAYELTTRIVTGEAARALSNSSESWIAGLYTQDDGQAEPERATPAIAGLARRRGATVHQQCAARGIETVAGKVSGVVTERGTIRTSRVLCAGGVWSTLFCRRHGIRLPQLTIIGSVLRTTPAPQVIEGALSTPGFSIRRRADGGYTVAYRSRIRCEIVPDSFRYAGSFWPIFLKDRGILKLRVGRSFLTQLFTSANWSLDAISPFERRRILDPKPDPAVLDIALANLRSCYPALANVEVAQSWGGTIDATPDAVPVISEVQSLPGFFLATGFSGHGFGLGPAAGRLAADLMTGARPLVDPQPFRYARLIDGTRMRPEAGL